MLHLPPDDDALASLTRAEMPSSLVPGIVYRIGKRVGEGGMAVASLAQRVAPEGTCLVVVKMLRPGVVRQTGASAALIVQKEAVALGRLNERVPMTPFVVRLVDTGSLDVEQAGQRLSLPWLALEYVHGGAEGTTLTERVAHSVRLTGFAFDPTRAAHALQCLAKGLTAVHEVGVIHRDIKPDNVLCCGFGSDEIFKVADFGVARPVGLAATFGGALFGTPGYAPPELFGMDQRNIGQFTDIFSFAAVVFYILTGERYFPVRNVADAVALVRAPARRSVLEAPALSFAFRSQADACRQIDLALARATAMKGRDRPQSAEELATSLLRWIESAIPSKGAPRRVDALSEATSATGWVWTERQKPSTNMHIRHVAWDGDGKCLAATNTGLSFWNGTEWSHGSSLDLLANQQIHFVYRTSPGRFLVGGDAGTVALYTEQGVVEVMRHASPATSYRLFAGDLNDIGVVVGVTDGGPPTLHALVGRRWLKPLPLDGVQALHSIVRMADTRFLIAGEQADQKAFAGLYSPLDWEVHEVTTQGALALTAAAASVEREVGLAVGRAGAALWVEGGAPIVEQLPGSPHLMSASMDPALGGWAGAAGALWLRSEGQWSILWEDHESHEQIVSIFTDVGLVMAMMQSGRIVEGRRIQ